MHIQGEKKKKNHCCTMYTTQHYTSLTLLYLNSQLITKFQTNSIFTLKEKKKKTLTDKNNYLPLKNLLSITFVKKKKKKSAIHISTKRQKKEEDKI